MRQPATWRQLTSRVRVDPLGPMLAAIAVVIFLLNGFGGLFTRDLALYAYGGQQFAEGVPPYVAVLNRAGPLAHMVPGVGAMIAGALGTDDVLTMRALMMVLSVIAVWLTYLLGRDALGSRLAGVASTATLLTFHAFITYATGGPREKTTMMLLVVCALLAVVHRRWAWSGVAIALATLTWQPSFFAGILAAVAAAIFGVPRGAKLRALIRIALGGIAATAVLTLYFVIEGELQAFLDGFVLINATATEQSGFLELIRRQPEELTRGFSWSLGPLALGLLGSIVLATRVLLRHRRSDHPRREPAEAAVFGFGVATVGSLVWSLRVFNGWADAVFLLPLASVGLGGLVAWGAALVASRRTGRGAAAVVAAYALVALTASGVDTWLTRDDYLAPMRAETEAMLAAAGPHVSVASIGAPQPLVFGHLRNPVRHQMFVDGLDHYVDETWPGGLEGLASVIQREQPTFITMDHPTWYSFMDPVLFEDYRKVGTTLEFTWYVDRSVGEEKIEEMIAILDSGP